MRTGAANARMMS